eukprot:2504768-Pleurochrysis_carterae.AAC.1
MNSLVMCSRISTTKSDISMICADRDAVVRLRACFGCAAHDSNSDITSVPETIQTLADKEKGICLAIFGAEPSAEDSAVLIP